MKLIGLTLAIMLATSCITRPCNADPITLLVVPTLAVAATAAAGTVVVAGIAGTATVGAAVVHGVSTFVSSETGGKYVDSAYKTTTEYAKRASCFFLWYCYKR